MHPKLKNPMKALRTLVFACLAVSAVAASVSIRGTMSAQAASPQSQQSQSGTAAQSAPPAQSPPNVAFLPGIVGRSLAMPDIHHGYGFPIGGVAATDWRTGVVSPGGVGFDINCGVRLLGSSLRRDDVTPRLRELVWSV